MSSSELRDRLNDTVIDRIRSCQYPSTGLMDRAEQTLVDTEHAIEYANVLMEKITRYPSLQLLDRLSSLLMRIEAAEAR